MKYTRRPDVVEAMRMPLEADVDAVDAIVEWITPAMTTHAHDDDWPGWGITPVRDWSPKVIYFENEMARLGEYIIKINREVALVMPATEFERKYAAVAE